MMSHYGIIDVLSTARHMIMRRQGPVIGSAVLGRLRIWIQLALGAKQPFKLR